MQIIDNQISDIREAYVRIQKAENELQSKWRKPLLAVYAQQREEYQKSIERYNRDRTEFRRRLRLGIWMASILLLLGILVLPALLLINEIGDFRGPLFCFSPLLILSGLTGWAIVVVLWIWQREREEPTPPQNPLKSELFYPLLPIWKEGLTGSLPKKKPHPDAAGEYHFITRLQSLLDESYILYGVQLTPEVDIDTILIGPKGIWIFEVIYMKGLIRWRDSEWSIIRSNRRLAKRNQYQEQKIDPGFDTRWQRASNEISKILQEQDNSFGGNSPGPIKIHGGLVFTHSQGRYDIPPGCPFNWGIVPFWLEKFQKLPILEGINDFVIYNTVDLLFERHRQVTSSEHPHSMLVNTEEIVHHADRGIQIWMDTNKITGNKLTKRK